ncbi:MAG TPA: sigma-70 family RNA polymerase sigma factor, partial [Nitriliruptorales bacterium]
MSTYALPTSNTGMRHERHERDGALARPRVRGNDEAFALFYRRYHRRLVGYCLRRTQCEALAEDLAHDTLLKAMENLEEFDTDRPAWPWLKSIAHNAMIDHIRKHKREDLKASPIAEDDAVEDDMTELLAERPILAEALSELPDRQQVAVKLRYVESWRSSEAGDFLDLSRPAFEQLLWRARKNLRENYERLVDETAGAFGALLLPLYRFKDSVVARLRARFAGWEQGMHAMGPAAFDAVGQAAATFVVLGLAAAVAASTSADRSVDIQSTPANYLSANVEESHISASAEAGAGLTAGTSAGTPDAAPTTKRHVELASPATDETRDVAAMGGHVDTEDTDDQISI